MNLKFDHQSRLTFYYLDDMITHSFSNILQEPNPYNTHASYNSSNNETTLSNGRSDRKVLKHNNDCNSVTTIKRYDNLYSSSYKPCNLSYSSSKFDSCDLNNHYTWESFAKTYKNVTEEIANQDSKFGFNSQFIKYFNEKHISSNEYFSCIIFDMRQLAELARGNSKNSDKEKTLKEHIATLMNHNKILTDENDALTNNISRLENLTNTINTNRSEIYTPRLFGELNEDNSSNKHNNNKELEDMSNYIKNLHEFYSNKLSIVFQTISCPENYETYNKQLREINLDSYSLLDDKFSVSMRNNLETLIQIQNRIFLYANKENKDISISIVQDDSSCILSRSGSFSCNTSMDFFQEIQNPKLLKQTTGNKVKLSESRSYSESMEIDVKKLQKKLLERESEIDILRKKELAYQSTIYSLSNELFELKKNAMKKQTCSINPHRPLNNIDFYSSKI